MLYFLCWKSYFSEGTQTNETTTTTNQTERKSTKSLITPGGAETRGEAGKDFEFTFIITLVLFKMCYNKKRIAFITGKKKDYGHSTCKYQYTLIEITMDFDISKTLSTNVDT